MASWRETEIGNLCDTISDTYKGNNPEVILINTSDVLEGKILNSAPVENVNLKGQFKKTFKKEDILYSEIRPANRRYAFVDIDDTSLFIASTKLMVLRPRKEIVNPRFLYAILSSDFVINEFQHQAETRSGTFPQITFSSEVAPMKVMIPDFDTQAKIVSLIDAIQDKIDINDRINKNLEEQAESLYNVMFVANAKPTWQQGTLSDLGTIVAGGTPSKANEDFFAEKGIAWITPKDLSIDKSKFISHGEIDISDLGYSKSSATKMPEGTVLFSSRAPIGYIAIAANEVTTNQGFKSVVPKSEMGTAFVYYFLKQATPIIEGMASGSTFKEISGSGMKAVPAIIPDEESVQRFNEFCQPIFSKQRALEDENKRLAALRDAMLPKLMSGEIDVSEVEI